MDTMSVIAQLWPVLATIGGAVLGFALWLVRLEGNVKANKTSISRLASKINSTDEDVKEVEQRLHAHVAGLQVDIKQLVAEVARMSGFLMYVRDHKKPE